MSEWVRTYAPGRVNLIGEHTDYAGGLALPMAIDLGTTVVGDRVADRVRLRSLGFPGLVDIPLDVSDPTTIQPVWGRYVGGVVAVVAPELGLDGMVSTTVPVGSGLSSSAALEVAVALALGAEGSPLELATACQRAEQMASGVPCGLMDQLTSVAGVEGHALLIDFRSLEIEPVPVPDGIEIVVVHSGEERQLATSEYTTRRNQVEAAEVVIGPLRDAIELDLSRLTDTTVRARARHVVTENERVRRFAAAFRAGDAVTAGQVMTAAHVSFRDDFGASTPTIDALVERLLHHPGVHGARLTGGGFGGCVVALTDPGALDEGWTVRASAGARVEGL